jgi:uncharacterized protein (TIGR03067 family)
MRALSALLLVTAAGILAADEPKKDDAEAFKGNWSVLSIKFAGQEAPADDLKNMKFKFDGKVYINTIGEQVIEEGDYRIDASKTPKTIDFDIRKGRDSGKKQLALYKIDGDKLTIVAGQPGSSERPKSLTPEPTDQVLYAVLERAKP